MLIVLKSSDPPCVGDVHKGYKSEQVVSFTVEYHIKGNETLL